MLRERVSTDIYVFTSDLYVQVTAGVIVTPDGVVMIDTLPFPVETREIAHFVSRWAHSKVRYLILTHYHADHTYGAYLFPQAQVIMHELGRQLLCTRGEEGLNAARAEAPELEEVVLLSPHVTLNDGEAVIHLGNKTLRLIWTPGHSSDMISVLVEEDQVLFAGDTIMPVPTIIDGDLETMKASLQRLMALQPESIVQGHGEVILRGEVQEVIRTSITYLNTIQEIVADTIAHDRRRETLLNVDIERCGLSRVALNGRAPELHTINLLTLYNRMKQQDGK